MTDHNANVSWRDLREFAGVDLAKSFILSWHVEAETLVIDIDLYLEPEHPFYETPRPAEKVCIRAAYPAKALPAVLWVSRFAPRSNCMPRCR